MIRLRLITPIEMQIEAGFNVITPLIYKAHGYDPAILWDEITGQPCSPVLSDPALIVVEGVVPDYVAMNVEADDRFCVLESEVIP